MKCPVCHYTDEINPNKISNVMNQYVNKNDPDDKMILNDHQDELTIGKNTYKRFDPSQPVAATSVSDMKKVAPGNVQVGGPSKVVPSNVAPNRPNNPQSTTIVKPTEPTLAPGNNVIPPSKTPVPQPNVTVAQAPQQP